MCHLHYAGGTIFFKGEKMRRRKKVIAALLAAATVFTFTLSYTGVTAQAANWEENKLTGFEKELYNAEIKYLSDILYNGQSGEISTEEEFVIPDSYVVSGNDDAIQNATAQYSSAVAKVREYIYWNHPELNMWGTNDSAFTSYVRVKTGDTSKIYSIIIGWEVSNNFRTDKNEKYKLDGSKLDRLRTCLKNADAVVSKYAGLPDYQKIKAYADWIADNNEYNHEAADNPTKAVATDFEPWEISYVFDLDPSTNVVCEGYHRTFQYLMDHSVFTDKTIKSKSVGGDGHGWNVVTIGNKNYFVDITTYDQNGKDPAYLLKSKKTVDSLIDGSFVSKNPQTGVGYRFRDALPYYNYSSKTTDFYSTDELALSDSDYDPSSDKSIGTGKYISWTGETLLGSQPQSNTNNDSKNNTGNNDSNSNAGKNNDQDTSDDYYDDSDDDSYYDDDDDYDYDDTTYPTPAKVKGVKLKNVKGAKVKLTFKTDSNAIWYEVRYTYKGKTHKKDAYRGSVTLKVPKKTKVKVKVRAVNWDSDDENYQQIGEWSATKTLKTDKK